MTNDLEQRAREALEFVPTSGVDELSSVYGEALKYGLEHGLYSQTDVDSAQVRFREFKAREALKFVPTSGVDELSQRSKEGLKYGLEHGLYSQTDVDSAQERYEKSKKKR